MTAKKERHESGDLEERQAVVLFADLIGSTVFANTLTKREYASFLRDFHTIAQRTVEHFAKELPRNHGAVQYQIVGDELCLVLYTSTSNPAPGLLSDMLFLAVAIARSLKIEWYLSDFNRQRVKEKKRFSDIAVGINLGSLYVGREDVAEGFAMNMAKRVEGAARKGEYTRIVLSRSAHEVAARNDMKVYWAPPKTIEMKGLIEPEQVFELKCFIGYIYWDKIGRLWEDVRTPDSLAIQIFHDDLSNAWLGNEIAIAFYYLGQFQDCIQVLEYARIGQPDLPATWLMLGAAFLNLAFHLDPFNRESVLEKAARYFEKAIELEPRNEDSHVELGVLYFNRAVEARVRKKPEKVVEKFILRAIENFENGMLVGLSKARAAYFRWLVDYWYNRVFWEKLEQENNAHTGTGSPPATVERHLTAQDVLVRIGWIENAEVENAAVLDVLQRRAMEFIHASRLPSFRVTINRSVAILLNEAYRHDPKIYPAWRKLALASMYEARKELRNVAEEECLFSTAAAFTYLVTRKKIRSIINRDVARIRRGRTILRATPNLPFE